MHRTALGLLLAVLVASAVLAGSSLRAPPSAFPVRASAVNLNLNYSDPASDVFKLWTSNNSHVTDASGFWIMSPFPAAVNLLRLYSTNAGANVDLGLVTKGPIAKLANTTYTIRLYPRSDNSTHYIVTYVNGSANLKTNATVTQAWNITGNVTISPAATLNVVLSKSLLGNITAWDIDATSKQVGKNYTYEDFVWSQPGQPGSAPAFVQGRVTEAGTTTGLANVNVSTGSAGYFTATNATGYYSLPVAPGNLTLTFSLSGYQSAAKTVSVSYQQTQTVNVALTRIVPLAEQSWFWVLVILAIVAIIAVALVLLRRRSGPKSPR